MSIQTESVAAAALVLCRLPYGQLSKFHIARFNICRFLVRLSDSETQTNLHVHKAHLVADTGFQCRNFLDLYLSTFYAGE